MSPEPTEIQIRDLFERLATAPRRFFELCTGVAPDRLATPLGPGQWSPLQVLRHLAGRDRETLLPCVEKILAEADPLLPHWDENTWMKQHGDVQSTRAVQLIDEWARLREKIAVTLFDLSPGEWARTGRHEVRGPLTLYEFCCSNADHDDEHYRRLARYLTRDSTLN